MKAILMFLIFGSFSLLAQCENKTILSGSTEIVSLGRVFMADRIMLTIKRAHSNYGKKAGVVQVRADGELLGAINYFSDTKSNVWQNYIIEVEGSYSSIEIFNGLGTKIYVKDIKVLPRRLGGHHYSNWNSFPYAHFGNVEEGLLFLEEATTHLKEFTSPEKDMEYIYPIRKQSRLISNMLIAAGPFGEEVKTEIKKLLTMLNKFETIREELGQADFIVEINNNINLIKQNLEKSL